MGMTKEQIKQALISIVIGALTIALVDLLQGLLDFLKTWMIQGTGGVVASATYLARNFRA